MLRLPLVNPLDKKDFRQAAHLHALRACALFGDLPQEALESIAALAVPRHLEKGGYLFREGDRAEGFYVVQSGAVNVHRVNALGRAQVIAVFRAGQSFAEAAVASVGGYPADAQALEPSTVLLVPRADFLALLGCRPELALRMLGSMSAHLRNLVGLLDDLKLKDVESRLAHWLLKRCPKPIAADPVTIRLEQTKRILAGELGTASETLSRTLAKWREQKLVRVSGKEITVLQPRQLDALLRRNLGEPA